LGEIEALIALGETGTAARTLAAAPTSLPTLTLEGLVELNSLAASLSPNHAQQFASRARRLNQIGLRRQEDVEPIQPDQEVASTALLHEAATLFAVPHHSSMMAHEIAALVASTGCADHVRVALESAIFGNRRPGHEPEAVALVDISTEHGERYVVCGRPRSDVDSQLTLMAVRLLARAAIDFAKNREREQLEPSLWPETLSEESFGMVVASARMKELVEITRRVASSTATVLILGESGTGKELLARAVHDASPRAAKPFVPFNCTAVSRDMLDSQLFGYRRGAFTGAHADFPGIIRAAGGGTLFLDEVGELPLEVQPKLLRFLESGEIQPLGEPRPTNVDVRIVAATNANLEQMVADGRFREDLFYRLNVVRLQVPPLRERREEIPLLVHHFVEKFSRESQRSGLRVAEETMEYLVLFKWPGNVRQLANEIRRVVALAESGAVLMPEHLSRDVSASRRTIPVTERPASPLEFVVRMDQPLSAAIQHLERSMVQYALATAGDRLEDAAHMLGLSRKGLYLKRQRLKIAPGASDDDKAARGDDAIDEPAATGD
jgi:DNA-binding NtrC family response regulator